MVILTAHISSIIELTYTPLSIKKSPKKGAFFTIIIVDTGEGNIKKYAIDFIDKYLGFFCCFMGKVQCPSFSGLRPSFTGLNLTGLNLTGLNLTGLNLTGLHLTGLNLTGLHLSGLPINSLG